MKSVEPEIRMALQSWSDRPTRRPAHASESLGTLVRRFWPACYAALRAHDIVPRRAAILTRQFVQQNARAGSRVNRLSPDAPLARQVIAQRLATYININQRAETQGSPFAHTDDAALPELAGHALCAFNKRWAARIYSRAAARTCRYFAGRDIEVMWREFERHTLQPIFSNETRSIDSANETKTRDQTHPAFPQAKQYGPNARYAAVIVQRCIADAIVDQVRRTVHHEDLIDAELRALIHFGEISHE